LKQTSEQKENCNVNRIPVFLFLLLIIVPGKVLARGGGGCLAEGTPILTPRGPVAIERLHPGDTVWTIQRGQLRPGTVQARIDVEAKEFLELSVAGRTLRVTPEHPFQIEPGVFRVASKLKPGDTVYIYQDGHLCPTPLTSTQKLPLPTHHSPLTPARAYNLVVTPGGTYLADGVVVHNKGCFLSDTQILKADKTSISISQVWPGDRLLAFTPEGAVAETVVRSILTHDVEDYIVVTTEQVVLRVTAEHPFYVGNGTFRTLESLKVGDRILAFDGAGLCSQTIARLEHIHARTRVYNLRTDRPHTFFANSIAVHNKGGGGHGGGGFHSSSGFHGSSSQSTRSSGTSELPHENLIVICSMIGAFLGGLGGVGIGGRGAIRNPPPRGLKWWFTLFLAPFIGASIGAVIGFVVGALVGLGIVLFWEVPGFGVFAFLIAFWLIVAVFKKRDKKDEDLDFAYSPSAVVPKANKTKKLLDFLARQDSTMAAEKLQETARTTFGKLEQCWQARDYGLMKPLLMPDLYAEHCSQLAGMKRNHEINMIADLTVERVDIVNVRYMHKADQREFTALISARARDYYVDDRDQKFLRGDRAPARFQEFWTFQLQSGAWLLREIEQSRESDKLKEENFVEMFTDKQVESVYAETASPGGPAGPWLEKSVETKASRIERLLNFLVQTDKMWNRQQMLERARQVFLDVLLAQESGDPATVKTDELFPLVADDLKDDIRQRQAKGVRLEFRNLCVRKVELILIRNYADNSKDEYTVRISAHAQKIVSQNGRAISQEEYVTPFEQFWTFGRLDRQWKLKEILPLAEGQQLVAQENIDEESDPATLQWFYTKSRAG
jgi:predicted lipid-binding transport protein (Tim44 family)